MSGGSGEQCSQGLVALWNILFPSNVIAGYFVEPQAALASKFDRCLLAPLNKIFQLEVVKHDLIQNSETSRRATAARNVFYYPPRDLHASTRTSVHQVIRFNVQIDATCRVREALMELRFLTTGPVEPSVATRWSRP